MDELRATFRRLRASGRKALIPFITGGDPDLRATQDLLVALEDAGADIIELGIPFSDPLADGPVIQASSSRALARGATPAKVLEALAAVRHRLSVPVVCLSYWNPMAQFGAGAPHRDAAPFLAAARASGFSGVVVPDLPVEEGGPLRAAAKRKHLATVCMVAPTSPRERLLAAARASEGFLYYVSVAGTTGTRRELPPELVGGVRALKRLTSKPVCVGFGISTPAQAAAVARLADGVIIGTALIRAIQGRSRASAVRAAGAFVARLRRAV